MYRILIVDDAPANISMLNESLKNDYKLSAAGNGKEALKILEKVKPDLILLDVVMPIMDGYETIKNIKADPRFKDIPVIFLTAQTDLNEKVRGLNLGAIDYITKPFYTQEVKLRVASQIALVESKKEIQTLLSQTLVGSTKMLLNLLAMTNPLAYKLSTDIRTTTMKLTKALFSKNVWEIEVASMLCLVGTLHIPMDSLSLYLKGVKVSNVVKNQFLNNPVVSARAIKQIPRLEIVAEIVERQNEAQGGKAFDQNNLTLCGIQILKVAIDYELSLYNGGSPMDIRNAMILNQNLYSPNVVIEMTRIISDINEYESNKISVINLASGMIIQEDIKNLDNKVIAEKGTTMNDLMIDYIKLLNEMGKININSKVAIKLDHK